MHRAISPLALAVGPPACEPSPVMSAYRHLAFWLPRLSGREQIRVRDFELVGFLGENLFEQLEPGSMPSSVLFYRCDFRCALAGSTPTSGLGQLFAACFCNSHRSTPKMCFAHSSAANDGERHTRFRRFVYTLAACSGRASRQRIAQHDLGLTASQAGAIPPRLPSTIRFRARVHPQKTELNRG